MMFAHDQTAGATAVVLVKPLQFLAAIIGLAIVLRIKNKKKGRVFDLIFDREVKFGIAVERFVAPNGEFGKSAPIFQPAFQFSVKAVHPPGRIGWTVIVVVGVADKDVVFESRDLFHA
jgi:hypothetical protein